MMVVAVLLALPLRLADRVLVCGEGSTVRACLNSAVIRADLR